MTYFRHIAYLAASVLYLMMAVQTSHKLYNLKVKGSKSIDVIESLGSTSVTTVVSVLFLLNI